MKFRAYLIKSENKLLYFELLDGVIVVDGVEWVLIELFLLLSYDF